MDRNTVLGFVFIFLLLGGYMWYNAPNEAQLAAQKHTEDSIARVQSIQKNPVAQAEIAVANKVASTIADSVKKMALGSFTSSINATEQLSIIENDKIKITLSNKGGSIQSIELKEYKTFDSLPLILADKNTFTENFEFYNKQNQLLNSADFEFAVANKSNSAIHFIAKNEDGSYIKQAYSLKPGSYALDYDVTFNGMDKVIPNNNNFVVLNVKADLKQQEQNHDYENQSTSLFYHYTNDDYDNIGESKEEEVKPATPIKWVSFKQRFFNISLINKDDFSEATLKQTILKTPNMLKGMAASFTMPLGNSAEKTFAMQWYLGPNKYNVLKQSNVGLENIVTLGANIFKWVKWLNRWLIIPLWDFLNSLHISYGLIVLIIVIIARLILFPLNFKTFNSAAKMRLLKPELDVLRERYKDDQAKFGQEQLKVYRKAGVNPLGGCLPQLIQIPVLVSIYYFVPTALEFRHYSFLWANDMSNFDSVLNLGFNIPMYGSHVSLFTLLMTLSTYATMYMNRHQMNMNNDPNMAAMKYMQYIFPVMFLGILNNAPAALSYYYLLQNISAIVQQFIIQKFIINEDKLKIEMDENRKKPEKKSGFQARLEQAYKAREEQMKQTQRTKKK
jgi:YidC/Oxa1 family membrane protein insertase